MYAIRSYYDQDNGHPFLIALYRGLLAEPSLRMVTISEARGRKLSRGGALVEMPRNKFV